jgi:hypothetical protein
VAVVAVGRCDTASGITARSFRAALTQKMGPAVQQEAETARPFGGLTEKTVPAINGAVSSARSDLYSEKSAEALKTLQAALEDVVRIAPSDARWGAEREAITVLAQVQLKSDKAAAEATLMRVYRVDPDYKPDTSLFPPSFQRWADTVRKAAKKRQTVRLDVTTSPPGKPVYVGGRRMGVGPVTLRVPAGEYRIEVDWGHRGLVRTVTGPSAPVELSAAVEGAVWPDGGPCLEAAQDYGTVLARFAGELSATRVNGTHTDTVGQNTYAVVTSVGAAGGDLREAQVLLRPGAPSTEAFGLLAAYVATGKATPPVEVTRGPGAKAGMAPVAAAGIAAGAAAGGAAAAGTVAATSPAAPASDTLATTTPVVNPNATRFEASIRVGFSLPLGNTSGNDVALSDAAKFTIPIGVDIGARIGGVVFVGGYFQYGLFGSPSSSLCSGGASCSSNTVRLGGEVLFHPLGNARLDPWFGVGTGWEWLNVNASGSGGSASAQYSGWEFVNLQVGLDFALGSAVKLGPYATFSIGQYSTASLSGSGGTISGDVTNKTVHEWLSFGLRFTVIP